MNFVFSILHYKTYDDTKACIDSIKCLDDKCDIVVVDNGSNNGSFEKLKDEYKDIHFIDNDSNLGFANANNIGYKFAKDVLKADYIAVINNDVLLKSKDFISKCINNFNEDKYYICGPDILNVDMVTHQNPMSKVEYESKDIIPTYLKYKIAYFLCKIGFYKLFNNYSNNVESKSTINYKDKQEDVMLQGSFVIFSPLYINKEDYAFYPGTFLYLEETIMYYLAKAKNYKMIYYPNISIIHKGGSSTKNEVKTDKNVYMFRLKNISKSLLVLKEVMDKYK